MIWNSSAIGKSSSRLAMSVLSLLSIAFSLSSVSEPSVMMRFSMRSISPIVSDSWMTMGLRPSSPRLPRRWLMSSRICD